MVKLCIVLGTRPEIIKMSPLIRACEARGMDYFILHTGQHYSYEMDSLIFSDLGLMEPKYNLHIGSLPQGEQIGSMLIGIEKILIAEHPDVVITLGDPNSAFAGTLAAAKLHIPTAHIEAGRRSGNRHMSEELNRLMIDQIADYLFTPNETTKSNLLKAGVSPDRIFVCGDPIVDAVTENKELALAKSDVLSSYNLKAGNYFLATLHRPENVEDKNRLSEILSSFQELSQKYQFPVILSAHPKTVKMIEVFHLSTDGIRMIKPLGYFDFLRLETDCAILLTDSGSLQEEACILHVPCVTLRDDTERPETISLGCNVLAGADRERILCGVEQQVKRKRDWVQSFGKPNFSERLLNTILRLCEAN